MARSILVFAVVSCAVAVCLLNSGEAQPPERSIPVTPTLQPLDSPPISLPVVPRFGVPVDRGSVLIRHTRIDANHDASSVGPPTAGVPNNPFIAAQSSTTAPPPQGGLPPSILRENQEYNHDRIQSLKQRYLQFAEKRAAGMEATELLQGIAEMRRHFIISELKALASESPDSFDGMRAEIATMALMAKDRNELEAAIRSLVKELEDSKPATRTERSE